jgi:hypothetical protein
MNIRNHLARGLAAAALLGLPACAAPRSAAPDGVRAETYAFTGDDGATGTVFRAIAAGGAEALRGVTDVPAPGGARRVTEAATLDGAGRLLRAEITVTRGCDGIVEQHLVLDRARGLVQADTPGGVVSWPVPTDAPWVVEPLAPGAVTPIAAWIGARAAASGDRVRVIRPGRRGSYRAPSDQVAVAHERGVTVVLGESVADVDAAFVEGVRPIAGGSALARRGAGGPPVSCASIDAAAPDVVR